MEEILASIRRIIAEDEKPGDPPAPAGNDPHTAKEDVLELTEMVDEEGTTQPASPAAEMPGGAPAALPDGRIEPEPPTAALTTDVEMVGEPEVPRGDAQPTSLDDRRLLSTAPSGAAAAAFARLAGVPRERRPGSDIAVGAGDRTLEDIVREALRPLLRAWLDDNLPDLVERLVRAEISRVVAEAGLR